ncbi:hypothetical protein Tsubulata_026643, partial [Turnera subulata]
SLHDYLEAQGLWDVIDDDPSNSYSDEADRNKDWRKKNAAALLAIQTSCGPNILAKVRNIRSAKLVWDTLAHMKEQEQKQGYSGQEEQHEQESNQIEDQGEPAQEEEPTQEKEQVEDHTEFDRFNLEVQTSDGDTPLHLAAFTQQIGIVECLIAKNKKLVQLARYVLPFYPVTVGCFTGQREITRYCYTCTPIQLLYPHFGLDGNLLFKLSIYNEWFGIRKILEMKSNHAYAMAILAILCKEISTGEILEERVKEVENLLFSAAQNGTKEIIIEILEAYPDLINAKDSQRRNLIMTAIVFRQEKIFSLLLGRKYSKVAFRFDTDEYENNMLHLAGLPPPPQQLAKISGAALQMQRELQWFKEVESVMTKKHGLVPNSNDDTPRLLFTKTHKQLKGEGEKWMKETASSSTVVGALIITIMFTAAFTVPGGNVQETGLPLFRRNKTFLIFIISDAISLFSSSTSVLMFLGILTSRYAEDDFIKSLPTKLNIGLSSLFLSIVAMMISFCATLIIMLHGRLSVIIPVVLLASVPIYLFAGLQFPLLLEIFKSTYFGIFRRNKIQEAFLSRC